jgi:hypothetical protein
VSGAADYRVARFDFRPVGANASQFALITNSRNRNAPVSHQFDLAKMPGLQTRS